METMKRMALIIPFLMLLLVSTISAATPLVCLTNNPSPTIVSNGLYQNTNSSPLNIFADGIGRITDFRGSTTGVSEILNSTGSITPVYSGSVVNVIAATFADSEEGIAINPNGTLAFVAGQVSSLYPNISVIDLATNTITNEIYTNPGDNPYGVAFSPDGTFAYVSIVSNKTISVIDVSNLTQVALIRVGKDPKGLAFNPNGTTAYVAQYAHDAIGVINVSTNTLINDISVQHNPVMVAVAPNGNFAYVPEEASDNITVINLVTQTAVNSINVGIEPTYMAINPSGTIGYVTNFGSDSVSVIDLAKNETLDTFQVGINPTSVAFNQSGALAYVTNSNSSSISVINVATNSIITTVILNISTPNFIAVNNATGLIYTTMQDIGGTGLSNTTMVTQLSKIVSDTNQSTTLIIPPNYYFKYNFTLTPIFTCNWLPSSSGSSTTGITTTIPESQGAASGASTILLPIIFFIISIFFFILGLYRFPFGSIQNVIVFLMAMLTMYLAFTFLPLAGVMTVTSYPAYNTIIPNGIIINPSYNVTTISSPSIAGSTIYWDFNLIYDLICVIFAAIGWIMRLAKKVD